MISKGAIYGQEADPEPIPFSALAFPALCVVVAGQVFENGNARERACSHKKASKRTRQRRQLGLKLRQAYSIMCDRSSTGSVGSSFGSDERLGGVDSRGAISVVETSP